MQSAGSSGVERCSVAQELFDALIASLPLSALNPKPQTPRRRAGVRTGPLSRSGTAGAPATVHIRAQKLPHVPIWRTSSHPYADFTSLSLSSSMRSRGEPQAHTHGPLSESRRTGPHPETEAPFHEDKLRT